VAQRSRSSGSWRERAIPTEGLLRPLRMRKRDFEVRLAARGRARSPTWRWAGRQRDAAARRAGARRRARARARMRARGRRRHVVRDHRGLRAAQRDAARRRLARRIESGDLVTIDLGARLSGYHADLTRAFGSGRVPSFHAAGTTRCSARSRPRWPRWRRARADKRSTRWRASASPSSASPSTSRTRSATAPGSRSTRGHRSAAARGHARARHGRDRRARRVPARRGRRTDRGPGVITDRRARVAVPHPKDYLELG
jgi:hypothetical protein